jgi:hypothetical protein
LIFEAYGQRIGIRATSAAILELAGDRLPPGSTPAAPRDVERWYSLAGQGSEAAWAPIRLEVDGTELFRAPTLHRILDVLEGDLRRYVAEMARDRLFVHAGVVGWGGGAVLLPGPSWSGKTTLVAELVRAGATYYSDEYAVLDARGRVHPFARALSLRDPDGRRPRRTAAALGAPVGTRPLPVGLVVVSRYRAGARWRPRRLSPALGALALMANTVSARRQPARALAAIQAVVLRAGVLKGVRGEAAEAARALLDALGRTVL